MKIAFDHLLLIFDFDLNAGLVTFVFSETVNSSQLQPQEVTFQNRFSGPTASHTLTGGVTQPSVQPTIVLELSEADINSIKSIPDLAITNDTTYISFSADLIVDMNGNRVNSISASNARQVQLYTSDQDRPSILFFNFNLDRGILTLLFNETVNVTSLDVSLLTLQSQSNPGYTGLQSH